MKSNIDSSEKSKPIFDEIWRRDKHLAEVNPAQIHRRRLTRYFIRKFGPEPQNILDIGCGTGELLAELTSIYPHAQLCGCDLSEESGKLTTARLPLAHFYKFNAEEPQSPEFEKTMDLITCCEVLEHCAAPGQVVKNAYRWLNKGGMFFLSVPSGPMTAYDKAIGHQHHYTVQEIKTMLESESFVDVNVQSWGAPFHTLYRELVRAASRKVMNKKSADPNRFFFPYWIGSKVFNVLFYLNYFNYGYQIFGYGYKKAKI
jgi:2-polyprenyl-3-methyl-5-hydroxy-6-metoxy-1,4-benzoquinol methylase